MSLEDMMAYVEFDELLEVTPKSLRLRKRFLLEHERKKFRKQMEEEAAYKPFARASIIANLTSHLGGVYVYRVLGAFLALFIGVSFTAKAEMPFPKPAVNDRLATHLDKFAEPLLRKITDRVYWAQYYDYSSFGFLIGNKGVIAIDCGWWPGASARALKDLRKITTKPVTHIVYTHGHADHIAGCPGLAEEANQNIEVIAHEDYLRYRNEVVSSRLPFIQRRATDQMGFLLERSNAGSVGAGVGPGFYDGKAGYRPPTKLVKGGEVLRLDGHD